jgi:hypothetical protein
MTSFILFYYLPINDIPQIFSSSCRNSAASMSGAGEKVRMLWITLVVSILKVEFEDPILVASPKDSLDLIAVEHRARRYSAGDIRDVSRSGSGVGDGWLYTDFR